LEKDLKTDPPCHPRACAIQSMLEQHLPARHVTDDPDCIQRNNYNEEKCRKEVRSWITATRVEANNGKVDALYECCNAFYKEKGDDARCVSCPKPDLLRYTIIC
jgi:hypothetical protein